MGRATAATATAVIFQVMVTFCPFYFPKFSHNHNLSTMMTALIIVIAPFNFVP